MIIFHVPGKKSVECADVGHCHALVHDAVWVDLLRPTEQEDIIMDAAFAIDLPTRPEMAEIEMSSRLYREGDDLFMTATLITNVNAGHPESSPVTFILSDNRLITVRHFEPQSFRLFRTRRDTEADRFDTGEKVFQGLMDAIIDRIADILEQASASLDAISCEIFIPPQSSADPAAKCAPPRPKRNLEEVLNRLGRTSDLISRVRESAVSLGRVLSFYRGSHKASTPEMAEHFDSLARDLGPLSDHASFLSGKVNFLLDTTLGLINIEQNSIIKIFTVAAVLFLPPTMVGTIYGMNFDTMPELKWGLGYPFAIVVMILSALMPYYYFKRRGWF